MDDKSFQLITEWMVRIETKVDQLIEFRWKTEGKAIVWSIVCSALFSVLSAVAVAKILN